MQVQMIVRLVSICFSALSLIMIGLRIRYHRKEKEVRPNPRKEKILSNCFITFTLIAMVLMMSIRT